MREDIGKNQSYARKENNKLVINRLRLSPASATMLVNELNLSNSAISSILKQLETKGIIIQSYALSNHTKGRKQVYYTLNKDYGIFAILCLSNNRCKIIISNIKEEILYKEEQEIEHYDIAVIYELILAVNKVLSHEEFAHLNLAGIYISVPGKVNSITKELQLSKHFDRSLFEENNRIIKLFNSHFSAPIYMYNDSNLSIIGERGAGELKDSDDSFLAYVDNGVGAAMILNGNFYTGAFGYAGEFGLMSSYFKGEENYLDEFISLRSIKNYYLKNYGKKVVSKELAEAYYKDQKLHEYILDTAHLLGKKLKDILEILNITKIVLQGRISYFGDDYLNAVREELNKSQNQCEVSFSKLNGDSIFLGAMSLAVDNLIDETTIEIMNQGGVENE